MHILYLDSSGTPDLSDQSKNYVLIGLSLHESSWFTINDQIQVIKRRYARPGSDPDDFEIHVKNFAVNFSEQAIVPNFDQLTKAERRSAVLEIRKNKLQSETDTIRREKKIAKYKETDPYIHLSRSERSQLLEEAIEVITRNERVRLFGEAIDKRHPGINGDVTKQREQAFMQVVARFDKYLQKKDEAKLKKSPRRAIDNGLLMLDSDVTTESIVEPLFRRFRQHGHQFGQLRHVIDVPFFGSSDKVGGLQLADVAAYVVRRYLDKGAIAGSHEERHFLSIFQRFDRDTIGNLHGLRHFVLFDTCQCLICRARGHASASEVRGI